MALTVMAVLGVLPAQPARTASLEAYGRLPSLEDVALSPNGTRLAFVHTQNDDRIIEAYSLADKKPIAAARVGNEKLRNIEWADETHLLIFTSTTAQPFGLLGGPREWWGLQAWDVNTHRLRPIPDTRRYQGVNMMPVVWGQTMIRHVQGHTLLFVPVITLSEGTHLDLARVDLDADREFLVTHGESTARQWLVDAKGELAAEQHYEEAQRRWSLKLRQDGRMREIAGGPAPIEVPQILGFGPVADTILLQQLEQDEPVWRLVSMKDGSLSEPMAERQALDSPIEDLHLQRMIGGVHVVDDARYVFFDPGMQLRWDEIVKTFPNEHLRLVSHDSDLLRIVVRVDGPRDGYLYELIDMATSQAQRIGDIYQDTGKPYEVRRITYAAADGLSIPAYLTLPRERAARKLPLIVLPHGGPQARDTADFDWWSQALADQGYAVLRPNYRGSALSRQFIAKGFGQWGRMMQTDLSDGVRYLAAQGIIDPARVCIVGASYGGYAALAGVTLDPGVYRCAVSVSGPSDLSRQLSWVRQQTGSGPQIEQRYWDRFMGVSGPADSSLDGISPIKHISTISVPVMLIHGKDDTVVPYEQSQIMYDAMHRANKAVELVTLKHEDHWLSRSDTRLQMLQTSVAFLREHNPPD